jgi:isopentenyl diphosphate isomerase/L-lactate dehydrogenase-like FMN-dependent dehydrogenase
VARARPGAVAGVDDYRRAAARRLPRILFDYLEGGASGEVTLAANRDDLRRIRLRPAVLRDVATVGLGCTVLGARQSMPLMLGPIGSLGGFRGGGEAAAFRAARAAGIPACLSSFSVTPPERLLDGGPGAAMPAANAFQLYVLRDRGRTAALLDRVRQAGFGTLVVTVDTAVSGVRERDLRNGLRRLARPGPAILADFLRHPAWLADQMRAGPLRMFLAEDWPEAGRSYMEQAGFLARQIDPSLSWRDLDWLRARWPGPLVVKGILTPEDARQAVAAGAQAVVVSNHGGRQLDGAASSIRALPGVVAAVAGGAEVLFDGGIRRGGDVAKALALGASACLLGRAYVYGLVAAGEAGVADVLRLLGDDLRVTLALMGLTDVAALAGGGALDLA